MCHSGCGIFVGILAHLAPEGFRNQSLDLKMPHRLRGKISCHKGAVFIILVNAVKTAPVLRGGEAESRDESFASTRWTIVLEAGDSAAASKIGRAHV